MKTLKPLSVGKEKINKKKRYAPPRMDNLHNNNPVKITRTQTATSGVVPLAQENNVTPGRLRVEL